MADADLTETDRKDLGEILTRMHGRLKLIEVEGNPRALIVKTTNEVAPRLRDPEHALTVGGKGLATALTSGSVGNLKRRASRTAAHGEVS